MAEHTPEGTTASSSHRPEFLARDEAAWPGGPATDSRTPMSGAAAIAWPWHRFSPQARRGLALAVVYAAILACSVSGLPWLWDDETFLADIGNQPFGAEVWRALTEEFWLATGEGRIKAARLYRPVVTLSYVLEHAVFGASPRAGHLLNLAIHLFVGIGAGALAHRAGGRGVLAGALMLVHPFASELLGIVTNRTDLLATAFLVAGLFLRPASPRSGSLGSDACLLLAALSKEVAFVAPALLLLWDLRLGVRDWRRALRPVAPILVALVLREWILRDSLAPAQVPVDIPRALASTGWAFLDIVAPVIRGPWPPDRPPGIGLVAVLVGLGLARRLWFPLAWCAIAFAPMAGWLPFEVRPAQGFLYLPLLGAALAVATSPGLRCVVAGGAWLWVVTGVVLQVLALRHYQDPLTFWQWAAARNPQSIVCTHNLVTALRRLPEDSRARESLRPAVQRLAGLALEGKDVVRFVDAATTLGDMAREDADLAGARVYYEDAIAAGGPEAAPGAVEGLRRLE